MFFSPLESTAAHLRFVPKARPVVFLDRSDPRENEALDLARPYALVQKDLAGESVDQPAAAPAHVEYTPDEIKAWQQYTCCGATAGKNLHATLVNTKLRVVFGSHRDDESLHQHTAETYRNFCANLDSAQNRHNAAHPGKISKTVRHFTGGAAHYTDSTGKPRLNSNLKVGATYHDPAYFSSSLLDDVTFAVRKNYLTRGVPFLVFGKSGLPINDVIGDFSGVLGENNAEGELNYPRNSHWRILLDYDQNDHEKLAKKLGEKFPKLAREFNIDWQSKKEELSSRGLLYQQLRSVGEETGLSKERSKKEYPVDISAALPALTAKEWAEKRKIKFSETHESLRDRWFVNDSPFSHNEPSPEERQDLSSIEDEPFFKPIHAEKLPWPESQSLFHTHEIGKYSIKRSNQEGVIKFHKNEKQAHYSVFGTNIYRSFERATPRAFGVLLDGRKGLFTEWTDGKHVSEAELRKNESLKDDFALHAILAKHGVIGGAGGKQLGTNILIPFGHFDIPQYLNNDGILDINGKGIPKNISFTEIKEFESMRNPDYASGKIFQDITDEEIIEQIKHLKIPFKTTNFKELAKVSGFDDSEATRLSELIHKRFEAAERWAQKKNAQLSITENADSKSTKDRDSASDDSHPWGPPKPTHFPEHLLWTKPPKRPGISMTDDNAWGSSQENDSPALPSIKPPETSQTTQHKRPRSGVHPQTGAASQPRSASPVKISPKEPTHTSMRQNEEPKPPITSASVIQSRIPTGPTGNEKKANQEPSSKQKNHEKIGWIVGTSLLLGLPLGGCGIWLLVRESKKTQSPQNQGTYPLQAV